MILNHTVAGTGRPMVLRAAMERWFTPGFRAAGGTDAAVAHLREGDPRGWAQGCR